MTPPLRHLLHALLLLAPTTGWTPALDAEGGFDAQQLEARQLRLAQDRRGLEAALAAMEGRPWHKKWIPAVEAALARGHDSWVETRDGWLRALTVDFELEWNRTEPDRELPRCVDAQAPGHPLETIIDLNRQLADHGIYLLVVPVPTRLHAFPELVLDDESLAAIEGDAFSGYAPGLMRFLLALNQAGVETLDLLPLLAQDRFGPDPQREEQTFLKYNMHWTPGGALRAAQAVAERVRAIDVLPIGERQQGRDFTLETVRVDWKPRAERMRGALQEIEPQELDFVKVTGKDGHSVDYRSRTSPLLLLGDSFASYFENDHASFNLQLFRALGQRIDAVTIAGGGIEQTRKALGWRKPQTGVLTKRIVVWLFSSTTLTGKDWHPVDFIGTDAEDEPTPR